MSENERAHTRYPLSRLAFAVGKEDGATHGGVLVNISTGGAMIKLVTPMRRVTNEFEPGMTIDVVIDDFPPLDGNIIRTTENLVAVSFFPDTTDEKALMGKIMAAMENESSIPHSG